METNSKGENNSPKKNDVVKKVNIGKVRDTLKGNVNGSQDDRQRVDGNEIDRVSLKLAKDLDEKVTYLIHMLDENPKIPEAIYLQESDGNPFQRKFNMKRRLSYALQQIEVIYRKLSAFSE